MECLDFHGSLSITYASLSGYLKKIGLKKTKAGFKASVYELTIRAYLAILLNSISLDRLVMQVDESITSAILSDILSAST